DHLGVCHGAAGVLAVADAFARHAWLPEADALRTRLTAYVGAGLAGVPNPAAGDGTLLGLLGAPVVLSTLRTGARGWLACLGLR
ncbi:subtilin biosynthesis protein spaC, partial [Streptomyces sp. SID3343]|nr:subtilin biosynthesis protein spaC [Streptomyces sp. SID3343]